MGPLKGIAGGEPIPRFEFERFYSHIPSIGTLFFLNFLGATGYDPTEIAATRGGNPSKETTNEPLMTLGTATAAGRGARRLRRQQQRPAYPARPARTPAPTQPWPYGNCRESGACSSTSTARPLQLRRRGQRQDRLRRHCLHRLLEAAHTQER